MGRNIIRDSHNANMMKWGANAAFKEQTKEVKKRGRKLGVKLHDPFVNDPRTPFEALRVLLGMDRHDWAALVETSVTAMSHIDRGVTIASVALAKRMQEEARIRGVAVTLDELYQHVIPLGYTVVDGVLTKEDQK